MPNAFRCGPYGERSTQTINTEETKENKDTSLLQKTGTTPDGELVNSCHIYVCYHKMAVGGCNPLSPQVSETFLCTLSGGSADCC